MVFVGAILHKLWVSQLLSYPALLPMNPNNDQHVRVSKVVVVACIPWQ